jgi:hypothetical protein
METSRIFKDFYVNYAIEKYTNDLVFYEVSNLENYLSTEINGNRFIVFETNLSSSLSSAY